MTKEEIYYNIYTWGIRKEGQTLSEKECKELVCITQEYADQQTKELTEELKRVTKKASILEQDVFRLATERIDLDQQAKEKDERIKELKDFKWCISHIENENKLSEIISKL